MPRHAIVAGGSIGGLFAANLLCRAGWEVTVLERSDIELSGRGAGIVTHDILNRLIRATGATTDDLGVAVQERVVFDRSGAVVARRDLPQVVTSWDRVHSLLRAQVPHGSYRLGVNVTGYDDHGDSVSVRIDGQPGPEADLLVGADGFRSAVRAQMLPEVQPVYSGYVVWRALAHEADLSEAVRSEVFPHFGLYLPTGTQIVGYPIAGPGNDLRPGHRRYNFVWYVPVPEGDLADMLTDADGHRHAISIPPPRVRPDVIRAGVALAERMLPPPFVEVLGKSEMPFFTPIYDHLAPRYWHGRVALSGDAASVARPHVGMGVTKAACDAEALARHLDGAAAVPEALAAYSAERQPAGALARQVARDLGAMIFQAPDGGNSDGRNNPNLATIVSETAVVPPPLAVV
ncbi:MAG: putative oxidoreductase [Rhodobacteraceae bacterium HLUCCA12]|nr:MAG: putative oxidoreductase [Rhodobacteraceae bacterium HLUCCA12]